MSLNIDASQWSLKTAGGIPYKLKEGGPTGTMGTEPKVQEVIIIRASDFSAFCQESFPLVFVTAAGKFVVAASRGCPGFNGLWTKTLSFKPFTGGKPWSALGTDGDSYAQFLELTIDYEPIYGDDPQKQDQQQGNLETYLEVSAEMGVDFLQLAATKGEFTTTRNHPGKKGEWRAWGHQEPVTDINLPAYRARPTTDWNVRFPKFAWQYVGSLMPAIRAALGKVNSVAMPLLGNAPPETVLFTGVSISRQFQASEDEWKIMAQLDLKFNEKAYYPEPDPNVLDEVQGQNHFFRTETGTFDRLWIGDPILPNLMTNVYETYDLNSLWS